jgi:hypothetical protein
MGTFSATRYSEQFILNLDRSTVAREITNQDYSPVEGARAVELYSASDLSAPDKNADDSVNIQNPGGSSQTMTLDEEKDLTVGIPSVEEFQSQVDMQRTFRGRQAQAGEEALDDHVMGKHTEAGIDISTTATTPDGFEDKVRDCKVALSDNDVPRAGRYMVLSPHYADLLSEAAGDRIQSNRDIEVDGFIGRFQGFDIFESTGVPETGSAPGKQHLTFGHRAAHTLAVQLDGVALVRNSEQGTFHGDILKSLMVYGSKVQLPAAYGDLEADQPS